MYAGEVSKGGIMYTQNEVKLFPMGWRKIMTIISFATATWIGPSSIQEGKFDANVDFLL